MSRSPWGTTAIQADPLVRDALERARKSGNVVRWERAKEHEQKRWIATCWHAIWRELCDAYAEQRAGALNWRLTQADVDFAERMALWTSYECDFADWIRVPENAAALARWREIEEQAKTEHRKAREEDLSAEARKRLGARPRRPDRLEVPIEQPSELDWPRDWPRFSGHWTDWCDRFLHSRRVDPQRVLPLDEPAANDDPDLPWDDDEAEGAAPP